MGKIVYIVTDPAVGGTFLTWSVHFLAGHTWYQTHADQRTLPHNPLDQNNAHGFKPNQPLTLEKFYQVVDQLEHAGSDQFSTVYIHNFVDDLFNHQGTNGQAIDHIKRSGSKTISLVLDKKDCLYHCHYASRAPTHRFDNPSVFLTDPDTSHAEYLKHFHNVDVAKFDSIWAHRDFLAMHARPFDPVTIKNSHDFCFEHYYVNALDLFTTFSKTIHDLFDYLEIPIDQSRLKQWVQIYHAWQHIVNQRLIFSHYFDEIVVNILTGKSMDLARFDLDLVQEAALQHILLYQFRRTLRSENLTNFNNTFELHKLLGTDVPEIKNYWPRPHLTQLLKSNANN